MGTTRRKHEREMQPMGGEIERRTVLRREYRADAKLTGDSPGAGTVCV